MASRSLKTNGLMVLSCLNSTLVILDTRNMEKLATIPMLDAVIGLDSVMLGELEFFITVDLSNTFSLVSLA